MKLLLLLGLCALACANLPNPEWLNEIQPTFQYKDHEFRAGREYRYNYNGQLATGLPGASKQHSATRIQAVVSILFKTDRDVLMKLTHVRMGRLNQHIPNPKALIPFVAFEQVPIEPELLTKLQKPVKFTYENGLIKDVVFDGAEEPWSANMKRGVMNMLSLDIKGVRRNDRESRIQELDTPDQSQDFYSTVENTLEGECETFYTVVKEPCTDSMRCQEQTTATKQVLNITKSVNFERCRRRPEIKYNFRFQDYCPSCEKKYSEQEKLIESSTITKYNISGTRDRFMIESACVESQHSFVPFNEDKDIITAYLNQTLELLTSGPIQTSVPEPSNQIQSDSDLIYTPDWDVLKEKFFQEGEQEFLDDTPYTEVTDKTRFVSQILRRLIEQMPGAEVKSEAPRQFARLVKILRMSKLREVEAIFQNFHQSASSFTPEQHRIIKDILVDALGVCATIDCTKTLVEKTKTQKISAIRASWALKSLVNVRVPSKQIVDEILSICEPAQPICERSALLKQTVYLTAGSVLNGLCAETPDKWAKDFKAQTLSGQQLPTFQRCPRPVKQRYVQLFINKIERATNWYEKVLYLKALGNSGIDIAVFELEKIIKNVDGQHSPLVRKEAILALRQMRETMPRKIQKVLMPIYMNRWEIPSVRITAVYGLLQTQPEKPVLDQIAKKLFTERSRQVASFIFSYSHSLANSTDPCEKRLADDLKMSLRHARGLPVYQVMESWFMHNSFYCPKNKAGFSFDLAHIISNYSTVPSVLAATLHGNYFGFWQKYLLSAVFAQENAQKFINQYLSNDNVFHQNSLDDLVRRRSPRSIQSSDSELKSIFRKLNIRNRRIEESMEPKAFAALKIKDQEVFILPVSLSTMPLEVLALFATGKFDLSPIERYLSQGIHFNMHTAGFIHEVNRKVPTALGLPLMVNVKIPTVARLSGNLKAQLGSQQNLFDKVKVEADLKPSLVATMVSKMEAWSPIVNSGLKVLNQARINTPLNVKVEVNKHATSQPKIQITMKTIKQRNELVTVEARPVTITRVWPKTMQVWQEPQEKTVPCEELKKISTSDQQFGDKAIGMKYRLKTFSTSSPLKYKVKVIREPGFQAPDEVVLKITSDKWAELMQQGMRPDQLEDMESMILQECQYSCQQSEMSPQCEECKSQEYSQLRQKSIQYLKTYTSEQTKESQVKIELYTTGSSSNRRMEIRAKSRCDIEAKHCKWQMDLVRSPVPTLESQPWHLECRSELLFPRTPYSISEISADKKIFKNTKCRWGNTEQQKQSQFIDINVKAQQSWLQRRQMSEDHETDYCRQCLSQIATSVRSDIQQQREIQQCKAYCSPVSIYNQVSKWSDLCEIDYLIKYQNVHPYAQNITNKLFRALKHAFYQESDVNQIRVRNPENTIKAKISIEPMSHRLVNVTIQTPHENTKLINIARPPLPVPNTRGYFTNRYTTSNPVARFFTSSQWNQPQQSQLYQQPICKVSSEKIETFDGAVYRAPITTCYTVLAKDCGDSEESKFAVLMRKLSPNDEKKKIKILTQQHRITLEPKLTDNKVKVTINGQDSFETRVETSYDEVMTGPEAATQYQSETTLRNVVEHGHSILRIKKVGPYLKIEMPEAGIKVYFDGYAANVKMSQMYKNQQCGLCGQYDMEISNEFHTSQGVQSTSLPQFFDSYLLKDGQECQMSEIEKARIQNEAEYQYTPMWSTNYQPQYQYVLEDSQEDSDETTESSEISTRWERTDDSAEWETSYDNEKTYMSNLYNTQYRSQGQQQMPIRKTKIVEYGHEICFSQTPVEECPPHSYPQAYQQQKTVIYSCIERSDPQAEVYHQKALRFQTIAELSTLPASFSKTENLPQTCVNF